MLFNVFSLGLFISSSGSGEQLLNLSTNHNRVSSYPYRFTARAEEGTETRPDYLANRADKKMRGRLGKKLHGNREIAGQVSSGGVGARVS